MDRFLELHVIKGEILGVAVLRGYARLSDLARLSKPDVYDQKLNPSGTQRDLSPKHAREAYDYVKNKDFGFWPEVLLCVRNMEVINILDTPGSARFAMLRIDTELISSSENIAISRVDGNHRLHLTDGKHSGFPAIDKDVSFCLAYNLTLEQEIIIFRDINNNQKPMNTSHLDKIEARLTQEEILKSREPDLYIAKRLGEHQESPLFQRIYDGGRKGASSLIPLRALRTGIDYMLSQTTKLTALRDAEAQYLVIRNYFEAVKQWQPEAWHDPSKYLVLRGAGLWGICFIGADVIDRCLSQGTFESSHMLSILRSGKRWDWSNAGDFKGYSGRGGAKQISVQVTSEFQHESGVSTKELYSRIMSAINE